MIYPKYILGTYYLPVCNLKRLPKLYADRQVWAQPCRLSVIGLLYRHLRQLFSREIYYPFKVSVTDRRVINTTASKDMNEVMKYFQNRLDRLISNNAPEHMMSGLRIAMQNTLKNHSHTSNWDSARSKNWSATSSKFWRSSSKAYWWNNCWKIWF